MTFQKAIDADFKLIENVLVEVVPHYPPAATALDALCRIKSLFDSQKPTPRLEDKQKTGDLRK